MIAPGTGATLPTPAIRLESLELRAGDRGRLFVTVAIPPGIHLQSHAPTEPFLIPTSLDLDATPNVAYGPVVYPTPHAQRFDWTPVQLDIYRGTIQIVVPITVARTWTGCATTIAGHLRYQACTEHSCLPPARQRFEASLRPPEPVPCSQLPGRSAMIPPSA